MIFTSTDLGAMKMPAIVVTVVVAISVAIVSFSSKQHVQSQRMHRDQVAALQDAKTRYQRSGQERETVMHYMMAYRQLEKIGFIGPERRLDWVEGLRAANAQAGLFGVDYQMMAQEPFAYITNDSAIGDRIKQSNMRLSFGLLHEADLMKLFRALAARQPGVFTITECSLDRAGREGLPSPRQANLTAQCELSWITIVSKEKS
jgi:hypothetical protein